MLDLGKKLKTVRVSQNLSLRELAAKAEVSASLLSQIENGKANPSVRSLHSIADALSMPVDYFFPNGNGDKNGNGHKNGNTHQTVSTQIQTAADTLTPSQARAARAADLIDDSALGFEATPSQKPVVRATARQTIELLGGIVWERLTPGPEESTEFLQICYDVGTKSGEKMSHHTGREFHYILEGQLLLELAFEKHILNPGDSIIFDSTVPHRLSNCGEIPMRAICVIFNQR